MLGNDITYEDIKKESIATDILFNDIQATWEKIGGENDIKTMLKAKAFYEKKYEVRTILMTANQKPVGICWAETTTAHYGNITFHHLDDTYIEPMIDYVLAEGIFNNKITEIVSIGANPKYKELLYKKKCMANIRQRMSLWLYQDYPYEEEDHPFTFGPYQKQHLEWAAKLSVQCHDISRDYHMYDEMTDIQKRIGLEELVWKEWYGKVIEPASLIIYHNNTPVGYCLNVEVKCWGFEKVPWIFDICIDPSYHGQGLGKALSKRCINQLIQQEYQIMGLAVTLSNTYAKSLYEKIGFQCVDVFYEFIKK
ncbi:hypothetical protein DID76_01370 [Candidatus Marinamargulisbacteria bacterium SCGC AG-414-C22]|nr:hypothetical protein DID76_01370 [Candidatus Marinamargulisbacteria bacterium SCGC AG-414-C22]